MLAWKDHNAAVHKKKKVAIVVGSTAQYQAPTAAALLSPSSQIGAATHTPFTSTSTGALADLALQQDSAISQSSEFGMCSNNCGKSATALKCPECHKRGMVPCHFCSQECFILAWPEHFGTLHAHQEKLKKNKFQKIELDKLPSSSEPETISYGPCCRDSCDKEAIKLFCSVCRDQNMPLTYFCSQECFLLAWDSHARIHQVGSPNVPETAIDTGKDFEFLEC